MKRIRFVKDDLQQQIQNLLSQKIHGIGLSSEELIIDLKEGQELTSKEEIALTNLLKGRYKKKDVIDKPEPPSKLTRNHEGGREIKGGQRRLRP